ncbi:MULTISPECIES: formyltetrahydrofolate deformylase [Leeuwenhoekiella]|jgi:formyltetrahydrofolate deformylase|uniref:formyltetrahydrofolate deformylase n=1 Tax=Leeuwenhoekiella TaxID=283735 RepID=UPI000C4BC0E3|nr:MULTISPECIES: formyltetrahydrofolate deformylase [Leeuwenhoekiella]MAO42862.1 formyltetrahydrofolate deformylase [Leeuwenhoekiella sp.]HBT09453.1 formyltetrahydrofolate deformylase [Leeuwenhoekiella sp.]HCW63280.1 formyltetrahydrofolate deformylase [Leeuwenhoekiella sp.]|tara:strand:- start:1955 stop:2809 length:855 start_codon:yes stop_codon:yes gene_type:complete
MQKITLLINCPDRKGIVTTITQFILERQGNIVYLDQHVDRQEGIFFMRVESEFDQEGFSIADFEMQFIAQFVDDYQLTYQLFDAYYKPRLALFVSKYDHCLYDLLGRYASGELPVEIPLIISNHPDLEIVAKRFEIPFKHIAVTKATKAEAEAEQIAAIKEHNIDLIVLARYMQIISDDFVAQFKNKIINIHHSFLPAFIGAKPYHAAFERGVKIIGATSHYVTADLDEGPIIEQEIVRVSHVHSVQDFILKGRDLEKIVLARAIKAHVEHKVLVFGNKTVIFS